MSERRRSALDRLVGIMPVDAVIRQVDVDEVLERIDVNALIGRIDLDHVLDRIDVDRLVERIDMDRLVERLDLEAVVGRSVRAVSHGTLGVIRDRGRQGDRWLERVVDRVRRGTSTWRHTGALTRLAAYAVDLVLGTVLLAVVTTSIAVGVALVTGDQVEVDVAAEVGVTGSAVFAFLYFFVSWAVASKTPGQALLGMRVERDDGSTIGVRHAAIRALVFPFSFILGLGLIGVVFGRNHRALHDVAAGTVVVDEVPP